MTSLLAALIISAAFLISSMQKAQAARLAASSAAISMNSKQSKRRKNAFFLGNSTPSSFSNSRYTQNNHLSSSFRLASVGGLARRLPQGLESASKNVQVGCLKPQLISLLSTIQRRFGRPVIITSGYRSPVHNREIRGSRGSLHTVCSAADIKVAGVGKWEVAKFVRSLPDRGGVGTYCHQAVHIDIGSKRDWNWGCSHKH